MDGVEAEINICLIVYLIWSEIEANSFIGLDLRGAPEKEQTGIVSQKPIRAVSVLDVIRFSRHEPLSKRVPLTS
jgi:hypothetical protein